MIRQAEGRDKAAEIVPDADTMMAIGKQGRRGSAPVGEFSEYDG